MSLILVFVIILYHIVIILRNTKRRQTMTPTQIKRIEEEKQKALDGINKEMDKDEHLRDYGAISRNAAQIDKANTILKNGWYVS